MPHTIPELPPSSEAVAMKLLEKISGYEPEERHPKDQRLYWLALYAQCLRVVKGEDAREVLKDPT